VGPRQETAVIVGEGTKDLVDVTVASGAGATITATADHPFWAVSVGRWVAAAALAVGKTLPTLGGGMVEVAAVQEEWT
jgi:hypothetical protein